MSDLSNRLLDIAEEAIKGEAERRFLNNEDPLNLHGLATEIQVTA